MIRIKRNILVVTIVLVAIVFYWFQLRPAIVRSQCANEAISKTWIRSVTNDYYRSCLAKQGIRPESLYVGR